MGDLQRESAAAGLILGQSPRDVAWLKELSRRYKLSGVRTSFVVDVIEGREKPAAPPSAVSDKPAAAGSIELC